MALVVGPSSLLLLSSGQTGYSTHKCRPCCPHPTGQTSSYRLVPGMVLLLLLITLIILAWVLLGRLTRILRRV